MCGRQGGVQAAGIGRGRAAETGDDVANAEAGPIGRRAGTDDPDPAALVWHRFKSQVAHVAGPIVLIVEALAGEFDPLHGRTAAGERDEHARRAVRVKRTEGAAFPLRRQVAGLWLCVGLACGLVASGRGTARSVGAGPGIFNGIEGCRLARRRGLPVADGLGKEPELQQLTCQHDGQRNGNELGVATFHE